MLIPKVTGTIFSDLNQNFKVHNSVNEKLRFSISRNYEKGSDSWYNDNTGIAIDECHVSHGAYIHLR